MLKCPVEVAMKSLMIVVNKSSHEKKSVVSKEFSLLEPSVVQLAVKRSDISSIERDDDSLVIALNSGTVFRIQGFFPEQGSLQNDLVIEDGEYLWRVDLASGEPFVGQYIPIDSIEPLLINESFDLSTAAWLLGGATLAGVALGGGGGGGQGPSDTTSPAAPSASLVNNSDGSLTITGTSEPGSTVRVRYPDGSTGTVTAGGDGSYSLTTPA
ncbi:hypothetical protein RU08_06790, partial [Pseudomonas fulva]